MLRVSMLFTHISGAVELEKLTLKKDALRKLKLPIEVKAGEKWVRAFCVYIYVSPWLYVQEVIAINILFLSRLHW